MRQRLLPSPILLHHGARGGLVILSMSTTSDVLDDQGGTTMSAAATCDDCKQPVDDGEALCTYCAELDALNPVRDRWLREIVHILTTTDVTPDELINRFTAMVRAVQGTL